MPTAFRHVNCQLVGGGMATGSPDITIISASNIILEQIKKSKYLCFVPVLQQKQNKYSKFSQTFFLKNYLRLYTQDKYYSNKFCLRKLIRIFLLMVKLIECHINGNMKTSDREHFTLSLYLNAASLVRGHTC